MTDTSTTSASWVADVGVIRRLADLLKMGGRSDPDNVSHGHIIQGVRGKGRSTHALASKGRALLAIADRLDGRS